MVFVGLLLIGPLCLYLAWSEIASGIFHLPALKFFESVILFLALRSVFWPGAGKIT